MNKVKVYSQIETNGFLEALKRSPHLLQVLSHAASIESEFLVGTEEANNLFLKACIDASTGLWHIWFEFELGGVYFDAIDDGMKTIRITSVPKIDFLETIIVNQEQQVLTPIAELQVSLSKSCLIELSSASDLAEMKKYFQDDIVLSNLYFENLGRNATEMLVFFIRKYRKKFNSYQNQYSFLWEDTPFKSALEMQKAMNAL